MSDKVLYADVELTIHKAIDVEYEAPNGKMVVPVESVTILPGQFVALADLPSYQREAALQGKIEGARVMTASKANILAERLNPAPEVEEVDLGEEETPATVVEDGNAVVDEVPTVVNEADEKVTPEVEEAESEDVAVSKK